MHHSSESRSKNEKAGRKIPQRLPTSSREEQQCDLILEEATKNGWGCSRNIDLVHFGTQKMPGKIGYCFKSGLAQYSSFIITMGLSFARYHLTRGDDPNFCSLLSLFGGLYKSRPFDLHSLRPPRPKIQFKRNTNLKFCDKKVKKIAERLQKITF